MAIYSLGSGASRIAGSRKGSTFQRTANGFIIRHRVAPKQKRSPKQSIAKNQLQSIAQRWKTLTNLQRSRWTNRAVNVPRVNSLGLPYIMLGSQYQQSTNNRFLTVGLPLLNQPNTSGFPNPPNIDFIEIRVGLNAMDFPLTTVNVQNNRTLLRYVSPPLSPGTAQPAVNSMKLLDTVLENQPTTANLWNQYNALFPLSLNDVGRIVWGMAIYLRDGNGQPSTEVFEVGPINL